MRAIVTGGAGFIGSHIAELLVNKNYEVIIVSDNSLDDSIKIATKFNASIIELPKNKGPANARNVGAKVACGDILLFIDSDVIINVDSLNIVSNRFISDKVEAIQGIY